MVNLKGRNFLTLRDYSAEEIEYLLDLAAKLKVRMLLLYLKRQVQEHAVHLKWQHMILAWVQHILILRVRR